jgi:propanol-preferring alcohol dehydrogenase
MYMEVGDGVMPFLPMTQGHENAGVISALGDSVVGFAVGDVVGVNSAGVQPPLGMFTPAECHQAWISPLPHWRLTPG